MKKNKKKTSKKTQPVENSLAVIERKPDLKSIAALMDGDFELAEFFMKWLTNGKNATKAYMEMHPAVDYHSATVLGSRVLAKVSVPTVLEALGLGVGRYMQQLEDGLSAQTGAVMKKFDRQGNVIAEIDMRKPDHKVRRLYHEPLGKMLKLEKEKAEVQINQQFNFQDINSQIERARKERGLAT